MNLKIAVAFILLSFPLRTLSQDLALADSLERQLEKATRPELRIQLLGELADLYMNLNNDLAEQYGREQMQLADESRDRKLMLQALFAHARRYYNSGDMKANAAKGRDYSQRALDLARKSGLDEYIAWAYIHVARGARHEGQKDKALNYGNLAVSIASTTESDSLKISAYNALANTYQSRDEKLLAFRNYLQALNIAELSGRYHLLKSCYENMATFYEGIGEHEKAKDYLFRSLGLTVQFKERWDRLDLYVRLGNVYVRNEQYDLALDFYNRCMGLADSLDFSIYKLNVYAKLFDMYFISDEPQKALDLVNSRTELRTFMENAGLRMYIDHAYALAYTALGRYDSASHYFGKAETQFEAKASLYNRLYFYANYANYFAKAGDPHQSLAYWLKAKKLGEKVKDISALQRVSLQLDSAYQRLGDYRNAYHYQRKYIHYKDSLETLAAEKDLLSLEVDNENKRRVRQAEQAEIARRERHSLQYMGITTAIAAVFILLVMLGIFSVSKTTIRILGFFAFIFLFEFIILLADHQIHDWTHGEPWKILGIKIALISILLPLHHYLEQRLIAYLTSRKLLSVNPRELLSRLSAKTEPESAH